MQEKFFVEIKDYKFNQDLIFDIKEVGFVKGCWPLVYILHDEDTKVAYVGETTDALARMSAHLRHSKKKVLKTVKLIMSDRFNKSATLDVESSLIRYMSGDGKYTLLNGNLGLANHTYYQQKELYLEIFKTVWSELQREGVALSALKDIDNSDLFKYSPYKSLTIDQRKGLVEIMKNLLNESTNTIMVEGGAGTGKSILAIYMFKMLYSDPDELDFREFGEDEFEFIRLVRDLQIKYPKPKVGLVVPMSNFRSTLKTVFGKIHGLRSSMVIGPAEVSKEKYDILVVDESHRLRRRVNLGAYFGAFDKVNKKLGFAKEKGNELDWIQKQSDKQILFYDRNQTIKPSDVLNGDFEQLASKATTYSTQLKSQLRSLGGNDYVTYIDRLLNCHLRSSDKKFSASNYEFRLFESFAEMVEAVKQRDKEFGLSRLVAGYAWEWESQNNPDKKVFDIDIDGVQMCWNSTNSDWINSENAITEVGCIHTTQGYDLNFVGVIFGKEISYDTKQNKIVVNSDNYYDRNGRVGIKTEEELKQFVINIYKTMMLRGIKGTYVYACDPNLQEYLKKFVPFVKKQSDHYEETGLQKAKLTVSPYSEKLISVPLYDSIGCGELMFADSHSEETVEVPSWLIKPGAKYFALHTQGDSMNELGINNGDIILCQKNYQAPSGSNAVVLIGDEATLKQIKYEKDGLMLVPRSTNHTHKARKLTEDDEFKVLGVFVCKINEE